MSFVEKQYLIEGVLYNIVETEDVHRRIGNEPEFASMYVSKNSSQLEFQVETENIQAVTEKESDDEQTIIKKTFFNVDESNTANKENVSGNLKRNLPSQIPEQRKKNCLSFDEEELLILEVQKREALWNFQLNVKQRNPKVIKILWSEVSDALNGIISAETAKNKFKSLLDTYRKIIQAEQKSSGSGRTRTTRLWHHYNSMEFLRDSCLIKTTVSNIPHNTDISDSEITATVPSAKRFNNFQESAIERIANAFCDASNNDNIALPSPPQPDDVDAFLNLLGSRIRQLSEAQKQEAFQKHLQVSYDMLLQNM